ncbi:MAG: hypothetical protein ACI36W_07730 [Coriobacteriales bacterium]
MSEFGRIERDHEDYGSGSGENLRVFEKTWGHRVLMGVSVCMFVAGLVVAIYCGFSLGNVYPMADYSLTHAMAAAFYTVGLVLGIAMFPPAVLGVYTATHPKTATAAVVMAVVGLLFVAAFVIYAISIQGQLFSIVLYAVLLAALPVIYLVSALKIRRS